jgi:hypothetical protein
MVWKQAVLATGLPKEERTMFHRFQPGVVASLAASLLMVTVPVLAQQPPPDPQYQQPGPPPGAPPPQFNQPSNMSPEQLNNLVSRIALYPDPLLAQIFAAATFPDQIPAAAQWADQHHYLQGAALAAAIQGDQLTFDPSVQALLPFPQVLATMAGDMDWTATLGNAFLSQGPMVEDAVQNMRRQAYNYGYLRTNPQITVANGPYITIEPTNPGYIVVPYYDPAVVFYRPWRPGYVGISFGYGIGIGTYFSPWGWGGARFAWDTHGLFINHALWGRTWSNRGSYVHPYAGIERRAWAGGARVTPGHFEGHALEARSPAERNAARMGRPAPREAHHEASHHEEHRH